MQYINHETADLPRINHVVMNNPCSDILTYSAIFIYRSVVGSSHNPRVAIFWSAFSSLQEAKCSEYAPHVPSRSSLSARFLSRSSRSLTPTFPHLGSRPHGMRRGHR